MGCPYFEESGVCRETRLVPDPKYSLRYCSKEEERYEKCAQFNLKRWKDAAHFDLRRIEETKYPGLRKFGSSQILHGIIREISGWVSKCPRCQSLQTQGKKGLCYLHSFYMQKTAYALQEIHGFNSQTPLNFKPAKHGPFSDEVNDFLKGQEFLTAWKDAKVDDYGKQGIGGLGRRTRAFLQAY